LDNTGIPWKPQCGENQQRGGFIGHSGEILQQQSKTQKFLQISSKYIHFPLQKKCPDVDNTAQPDLALYSLVCMAQVRPMKIQPIVRLVCLCCYSLQTALLAEKKSA
jgi:hypothetical protein